MFNCVITVCISSPQSPSRILIPALLSPQLCTIPLPVNAQLWASPHPMSVTGWSLWREEGSSGRALQSHMHVTVFQVDGNTPQTLDLITTVVSTVSSYEGLGMHHCSRTPNLDTCMAPGYPPQLSVALTWMLQPGRVRWSSWCPPGQAAPVLPTPTSTVHHPLYTWTDIPVNHSHQNHIPELGSSPCHSPALCHMKHKSRRAWYITYCEHTLINQQQNFPHWKGNLLHVAWATSVRCVRRSLLQARYMLQVACYRFCRILATL